MDGKCSVWCRQVSRLTVGLVKLIMCGATIKAFKEVGRYKGLGGCLELWESHSEAILEIFK